MSATQLSIDEQIAIDMELHRAVGATHYERLGLPEDAGPEEVPRAFRERSERWSRANYGGRDFGDYLPRVEQLLHKLEESRETLLDPLRRALYDESLRERAHRALMTLSDEEAPDDPDPSDRPEAPEASEPLASTARSPSSPPPSRRGSVLTPERPVTIARVQLSQVSSGSVPSGVSLPQGGANRLSPPKVPLAPRPPSQESVPDEAPERLASPEETAFASRRVHATPVSTPAPLTSSLSRASMPTRASVAPPPIAAPIGPPIEASSMDPRWVTRGEYDDLKSDIGGLLQELNTLCRAVEFCLAVAEPGESPRRAALSHTRGAIAAIRARRAEREQEWSVAVEHWGRAILANPTEPGYHAHLAELLLRSGGDLELAEDHALRAVELGPELKAARSTLAAVLSRRGF